MRTLCLLLVVAASMTAVTPISGLQIWNDLKAKRDALTMFHQEFDVSRTFRTVQSSRASKSRLVLDVSINRWRGETISALGNHLRIFDSENVFELEEDSPEYVRHKTKDVAAQPEIYTPADMDLSKAVERGRRPCGLTNVQHECVVLEIPVKPRVGGAGPHAQTIRGGAEMIVLDTETGLIVFARVIKNVDYERGAYQVDTTYTLQRMKYGGAKDESVFRLPASATTEVKELSRWDAPKIKKQLAGKTAPAFDVTDIHGKPISLAALKGKTVLIDFWTTWCGPCRADAPSVDKLYRKYGEKNLAVIGVSVDEDRPIVQKFLSEHPHEYPIVLSSENEMPRAYQIGVFPTYIVIDTDGNLATATQGEEGFSTLRKLLKKAGLDTD